MLREQVIQVKLFGKVEGGKVETHVQKIKIEAKEETHIECTSSFKPEAALLNSGNFGYARVLINPATCSYFLSHIGKVEEQLDRSYLWMILYDQLTLCNITPKQYIQCFIENIAIETEQTTLIYLTRKIAYIMKYFIKDEDQETLSAQVFDCLVSKIQNLKAQTLRNLILDQSLLFASTPEQKKTC